jgi:hypothetical protein
LETQKNDENFHGNLITEYEKMDIIWGDSGPVDGAGPYLPTWQSAPVVPYFPPYNWDAMKFHSLAEDLPQLFDDQKVLISGVPNLPDPNDPAAVEEATSNVDWVKDFIMPDEDPWEPMSNVYYPMLDTAADSVTQRYVGDGTSHTTVGILSMTFFWRDLLKGILPPGTNGVIAVFENECGQSFTYQIVSRIISP